MKHAKLSFAATKQSMQKFVLQAVKNW